MHIEVKNLPEVIRSALRSVEYGRADIRVEGAETYTPAIGSDQGRKAFVMAIELASGRTETHWGSWGGSNMFNPSNAVDLDTSARPIAPGFAIVQGWIGNGTSASVLLHPSNIAAMLPERAALTDRQRYLLNCYASLTSAGRKNEWERNGTPSGAEVQALADLGMLKINKAGAVSITTLGKNNRGRGSL